MFVFDWWVHNEDRTRGNPNLLWGHPDDGLVVIDHNQAFDPTFSPTGFFANHIFAADGQALFGDLVDRIRYSDRLEQALGVLDRACDNAPPDWRWENDEQDVPAAFDPLAARALLARCSTPDFWRRP